MDKEVNLVIPDDLAQKMYYEKSNCGRVPIQKIILDCLEEYFEKYFDEKLVPRTEGEKIIALGAKKSCVEDEIRISSIVKVTNALFFTLQLKNVIEDLACLKITPRGMNKLAESIWYIGSNFCTEYHGTPVRTDGFFNKDDSGRSSSDEIFEGIM